MKPPIRLLARDCSLYTVFFLSLCATILFLGHPEAAQAQGCNSAGFIKAGTVYCIAETSSSGNNPQMPVLSYGGLGSACDTYSYILELDFAQPGDAYGNGQTYGVYQSGPLPGNVVWQVNWSNNSGDAGEYGEGGNGSIEISEDEAAIDDFSFYVGGQTPTTGSITAVAAPLNPPWWFGHALSLESSNLQFWPLTLRKNGYYGDPQFGPPDGFGVTQIDGSGNPSLLTDNIIWTWTLNLRAGIGLATAAQTGGQTYWGIQYGQMQQYAAAHQQPISAYYPNQFPDPVDHPIPALIKGFNNYCGTFSPTGTGRGAYFNGFGLVGYNAGNPDNPSKGGLVGDNKGFASFNIGTGGWNYFDWDYVYYVCNEQSMTLPN